MLSLRHYVVISGCWSADVKIDVLNMISKATKKFRLYLSSSIIAFGHPRVQLSVRHFSNIFFLKSQHKKKLHSPPV